MKSLIALGLLVSCNAWAQTNNTAENLGWIVSNEPQNLCGGYYSEPLLSNAALNITDPNALNISAKEGSLFLAGRSHLTGDVVVTSPGRLVNADEAFIYRDGKSGKITKIQFKGNVVVREHGRLAHSNYLELDLLKGQGELKDVLYRLNVESSQEINNEDKVRLGGTNAWGRADSIKQVSPGVFTLENGSYATCPPPNADWQITAKTLQ